MGNARARAVFAAVLAAHVGLALLLSLGLRPRTYAPMSPAPAVAPIYLADLRRKPRPEPAARPAATRLPVLSRPADAAAPVPAPDTTPPVAAPAHDGEAERLALSRTLRGSRAGCATPDLLTHEERARCDARLAEGAKLARYIPTPLPPERRAFYDAVAAAKRPARSGDIVRSAGSRTVGPTAGLSGLVAGEGNATRAMGGHSPGLGCKLAFGGRGGGWKKPPHALKLGPLPCYVTPPQGPLTVEAGIQNPDAAPKP